MMALQAFFYDRNDNVENMCMYKAGGFHLVLLDDVLFKNFEFRKARYRIMQKLGHGGSAQFGWHRIFVGRFSPRFTIMVTDPYLVCSYVAVKINVSCVTGKNNEAGILRWLRDLEYDQPGYENMMRLLNDLAIQGPNGTHDCLVTEVVAGMNDFKYTSTFKAVAK